MLSLLHTIYTKNNKQQENSKLSDRNYHIQDMKYVQHKIQHVLVLSEVY